MIRFDASDFYDVAGWLYKIEGITAGLGKESELLQKTVEGDTKKTFLQNFKHLRRHLESIGANITIMSVDRAVVALKRGELTYSDITDRIKVINDRLFDELSLIKLYVFDNSKIKFLDAPLSLFGEKVSNSFHLLFLILKTRGGVSRAHKEQRPYFI